MAPLEDFRAPTSLKLSLLWTALMFLYIYNDYFSLYLPGTVDGMIGGKMGPLGTASATTLLGVSILLAVPALMICFTVILTSGWSRALNIALGLVYTLVESLTLPGSALFYKVVVLLEILLTVLIVWHAVRWPRSIARK